MRVFTLAHGGPVEPVGLGLVAGDDATAEGAGLQRQGLFRAVPRLAAAPEITQSVYEGGESDIRCMAQMCNQMLVALARDGSTVARGNDGQSFRGRGRSGG